MYRITGKIQGVAPLLFNRMTEETGEVLRGGGTGGKFTDEQRTEEAARKVYRNGHGLYLPPWNLKKCLLEGCRRGGLKEGKASMAPFIEATVFVEGDLLFGREEPDGIHESVGKRPPRTGGACIIKRPMLNAGWELPFTLLVADNRRSADHIHRALEEAGLLVGLGSWRPEYGRFLVTEWSVSD